MRPSLMVAIISAGASPGAGLAWSVNNAECSCVALVAAALLLVGLQAADGALTPEQVRLLPPASAAPVVFARDIKPIFEARCLHCHGRGRDKGGFRLDTRELLLQGGDSGAVIKPGHGQEGLLIALVSGLDPDDIMPKKGNPLTPEQVGLLRAWIDQGLPWDANVSFARPPAVNLAPPMPGVKMVTSSPANPVDQILGLYYATKGGDPGAVVSDRVFARRLYLDLIGLLPPADELAAFDADRRPDKRVLLAKAVLADGQAYAEHWLSFWNDLLRNDYRGTGYIDGGRESISPWLFNALRTNMPYDRFVAELVNPVPGSVGFTKGIVWRGAVNASQTPPLQAAQGIAQVFLGVNLKCASCHDSFVSDWRLSDAYGLAAVYSEGPLEMFQCDKPTGKTVAAQFLYPELGEIDAKADRAARLKRLAEVITGPKNGRLPRTIVNRLWARLFGRGLVESVDEMEQPAWDQDLLDWLAQDLVASHYDLKHTLELMVSSRAYQLPAVNLGETVSKDYVFRGPAVRRLSAEQFHDAISQVTGVWYEKPELAVASKAIRASLVTADPLAVALGRPNREQIVTTRPMAATTLQGLELTHGQTLAHLLHRGAASLAVPGSTPARIVDRLYTQALGRLPTAQEAHLAADLVGEPANAEGVEDLLWAVAMLPEFQLIY